MKSSLSFLLLAASVLLSPAAAHAWVVVVPTANSPSGVGCVDVVSHRVEVLAQPQGASSGTELVFSVAADESQAMCSRQPTVVSTVIVPALSYDAPAPTASLDGGRLPLERLEPEQGGALLLELAARRPRPDLVAAVGLPLYVATVDLTAWTEHRLEVRSAPSVDRAGATPRLVQPLRHLGTACYAPATEVQVELRSDEPIGAVFTPYHDAVLTRASATEAHLAIQVPAGARPHDLHLYLSAADGPVAADLLSYRAHACDPAADDGLLGYLLLAAGPTTTEVSAAVPKDLVLVIDTSGSMEGDKIVQVREALDQILSKLGPEDRFELITFSGEAHAIFGALQDAGDPGLVGEAQGIAARLRAEGSTNIHEALLLALAELSVGDHRRPRTVFFLTDGQATAGTTDTQSILEDVAAADELGIRIFTFGVGFDVNTHLLDELARQSGGSAHYVVPGERIEPALAGLYQEMQAPVLTGTELVAQGTTVTGRYPEALPDLFVGSQMLALARYSDSPAALLSLRGLTQEGPAAIEPRGRLMRRSVEHAFLPRLWASRRLGELLYAARLSGGDEQIVAQIQTLASRHGFVTPWTPFLAEDDGAAGSGYDNPTSSDSGEEAVNTSEYINEMAGNSNAAAYGDGGGGHVAPMKMVLDRTFVMSRGRWVDTTTPEGFDPDADPAIRLAFLGEGWRQLLWSAPELRELLAVGRNLVLRWRCETIVVFDPGAEDAALPEESELPDVVVAGALPDEPIPAPERVDAPSSPDAPGDAGEEGPSAPQGPGSGNEGEQRGLAADGPQSNGPGCTLGGAPSRSWVALLLLAAWLLGRGRRTARAR